jgi:hypothetical protein
MPRSSVFSRSDRDSELDAKTLGAIPSLGTISVSFPYSHFGVSSGLAGGRSRRCACGVAAWRELETKNGGRKAPRSRTEHGAPAKAYSAVTYRDAIMPRNKDVKRTRNTRKAWATRPID